MRRYSEAVKADVKKQMSLPHLQNVAEITAEPDIHVESLTVTGRAGTASLKNPDGWGTSDKFTVQLKNAGLNVTELSSYCRERGLYPEHVDRADIVS